MKIILSCADQIDLFQSVQVLGINRNDLMADVVEEGQGDTILQMFRQLFSKESQKPQERGSILPRNRFADLNFEQVLKSGTRCCVDEDRYHAKDGRITLFEFSIDLAEFELIGDFEIEGKDQFKQLLTHLNGIGNAVQSYLESEVQQPIPQFVKNSGYTQKGWEKTSYFHPWISSSDEDPPNLRYVVDHINNEFAVSFAKKHDRWKVYWNEEYQDVIKEQLDRVFIEI